MKVLSQKGPPLIVCVLQFPALQRAVQHYYKLVHQLIGQWVSGKFTKCKIQKDNLNILKLFIVEECSNTENAVNCTCLLQ